MREQTVAQGDAFLRQFDSGWLERFQAMDRVSHIRRIEGHAEVAAIQATLWKQWVSGGTRMQLRNHFDCRLDSSAVGSACVQRAVSQVVIDMPHPPTVPLGGNTE